MATVSVTPIENFEYAVRMHWERSPLEADVRQAFADIMIKLDSANQDVYIVVDILSKPRFPLALTINLSSQAHRHPNMGDWLVIGENIMAKLIGRSISALSDSKVLWFKTEEEAMRHLARVTV
jgi:hypothetical protein